MMERTIEQMVASAILEKATDSIKIEDKEYPISDPSIATLILVSEIISTLPVVQEVQKKEEAVYSALHYAKDFRAIGDICAILILGANNLTEEIEEVEYEPVFLVFKRKTVRKCIIDRKRELADLIMANVRPSVVFDCLIKRLQDMEIGHFFSIITSLNEANILKPTREVEH